MNKNRLEAFSDGVFAIIITIMVLEIKVPEGTDWASLDPVIPILIGYLLSFLFVGIYWVNHHHLLHTAEKVNGTILWANMHLLFWLSLIPIGTYWMGRSHFAQNPVAVYASLLLLCGLAFTILQRQIVQQNPQSESLKLAYKKSRRKGLISIAAYTLALCFAFIHTWISCLLFFFVSVMWFFPDKNIEKAISNE